MVACVKYDTGFFSNVSAGDERKGQRQFFRKLFDEKTVSCILYGRARVPAGPNFRSLSEKRRVKYIRTYARLYIFV